jgi:GTP-binding protein
MKFVDEVTLFVSGGHGGRGCVSFRREKFVPRGGPDGGDGGDGGDVVLEADEGLNTLLELGGKRHFRGKDGGHGKGKGMYGRRGERALIRVPVGTVVKDARTGKVMVDLIRPKQAFVAAYGGKGGRGNLSFATSTNRAPRHSQPGRPGEERTLALELKLLADVGLVGLPNSGKSTLISKISAARPKIADYPFTTLNPQLGVVKTGYSGSFTVADIPGLIEGAHQGAGMGIRFLKHIERTRILLHLIDLSEAGPNDPYETFLKVDQELRAYAEELARRERLIVFTKLDLIQDPKVLHRAERQFQEKGFKTMAISAITGQGMEELLRRLAKKVLGPPERP